MARLWDKGLPLDERILRFTAGEDHALDERLVEYDVRASIAHARMLERQGLIPASDADTICEGLAALGESHANGEWSISLADEDAHGALEARLIERIGEAGGRVHLGRSRNDQVLVALRLYLRDAVRRLADDASTVVEALGDIERQQGAVALPGYTHMQQAMPSSVALWAAGFATELRDDPSIVAVVGHINSGATLAAAKIYNDDENGIVAVSPASSSPLISDAGPWIFRVCPSDLLHGPALARWAYERLGAQRVAAIYANDDYGRGVIETFGAAFVAAGGQVLSRDPYLPDMLESANAVDPYLERAVRNGMDALMIAGQADAAERIIAAARRLGYTGPVIGPDGLTNLRDAGSLAEGVYISSAFLPDRQDPAAQAFVRAYQERFRELPDHRGAMTYDAIRLLARAIEQVGTNRTAIRDYLANVGQTADNPAFEGVSGTIRFDANGDVAGKEVTIGVVRAGRLVTAGS